MPVSYEEALTGLLRHETGYVRLLDEEEKRYTYHEIVLSYMDSVVVVKYDEGGIPSTWIFTPPDVEGRLLVRVPTTHVGQIYTEVEVDQIMALEKIDDQLLRYAT